MVLKESFNYVVFDNPVSKGINHFLWNGCESVTHWRGYSQRKITPPVELPADMPQQWKQSVVAELHSYPLANRGGPFLRLAGLSGAAAVILGAYGAHAFFQNASSEKKNVFETANRYHFIHTLALCAVPMTRRPALSGVLLLSGMSIFCGTCYLYALSDYSDVKKYTPYGGMLLIFAWLSFIL